MDPQEIASSPLFGALNEAELSDVAALMERRGYSAGDVVFHQGDIGDRFFYVAEGKVQVWLKLPDGGSRELATLGPGQYFGELALLDDLPRSADVICGEESELWSLEREQFINLLRGNTNLAIKILRVLGRRLRQANRQIQDLSAL
jgi:CRP/FNR family transcriptional regulator, cyclic AMP receptor protein